MIERVIPLKRGELSFIFRALPCLSGLERCGRGRNLLLFHKPISLALRLKRFRGGDVVEALSMVNCPESSKGSLVSPGWNDVALAVTFSFFIDHSVLSGGESDFAVAMMLKRSESLQAFHGGCKVDAKIHEAGRFVHTSSA